MAKVIEKVKKKIGKSIINQLSENDIKMLYSWVGITLTQKQLNKIKKKIKEL